MLNIGCCMQVIAILDQPGIHVSLTAHLHDDAEHEIMQGGLFAVCTSYRSRVITCVDIQLKDIL